MDTTILTLPKDLMETVDEIARCDGRTPADVVRTALEIYAERAAPRLRTNGAGPARDEATRPEVVGPADESVTSAERGQRRFASLGVGESTLDDGYDSTNIKDWIRKTWRPNEAQSHE